jgi:uncharacterized protein (TIGR02996 family)
MVVMFEFLKRLKKPNRAQSSPSPSPSPSPTPTPTPSPSPPPIAPPPPLVLDDAAHKLLRAIADRPSDGATRAVLADWLEEHGQLPAAELITTQLSLDTLDGADARLPILSARLRELAEHTPPELRWVLARAPIESCAIRFQLVCPKRWDSLAPTDTDGVRFCGACQKKVFYAATVTDARRLARAGGCVAVDLAQARSDGDLAEEEERVWMGVIQAPPPPRHALSGWLVVGDQTYPLQPERTVIGRSPDCDIAIVDRFMLEQHCEVHRTNEGFEMIDLGSPRGIVFQDRRVRQLSLVDNDEFQLGRTRFRFKTTV